MNHGPIDFHGVPEVSDKAAEVVTTIVANETVLDASFVDPNLDEATALALCVVINNHIAMLKE